MACRRLVGKVAVVTASTEGIGYAIAERLAQEGAKTVVSSRKQKNVDSTVAALKAKGLDVFGLTCHVAKEEDRVKLLRETVSHYGGVDILVSNAAANPTGDYILDTPDNVWQKIFDINVKSAFLLAKEFTPEIEKRGGGSIVFVSSIAGFRPVDPLATYGVSKTALLGLTKALVPQLASKNIRVNSLAPGLIRTKFSSPLWDNPSLDRSVYLNDIPMDRIGEPSECAGAVAFLVSDDASYVTGETIIVAGGMNCRL